MRVKRNCSTTTNDFIAQSEVVKRRFVDKGYNPQYLDTVVEEVLALPRENCLSDVVPHRKEWGFISGFYSQYKEIESIFEVHWHVLLLDKTLKPVLYFQSPQNVSIERHLVLGIRW